ncbi:MAG TPA: hypothetical protein VGW58_01655 [Pyrinomonadaceae bacterium]|nr:hypothetical protein [Pyrinomonadaceae bacterium]
MVQQPHFDDELTVMAARPVVPLEKIDARVKHRRRWFLGGAFAIAMFLGAASALISAYFKLRNAPQPEIQTLSVLSVPEEAPQPQELAVITERPKPRPIHRDYTDRPASQPLPDVQPRRSEEEELRSIREAVLFEQWQERRGRRVERREERRERRRAQHNDRDLSNINEIFEGLRRP